MWFDPSLLRRGYANERRGQRGAPTTYSASLMLCLLTLKAVYHLSNRETQGFMQAVLRLLNVSYAVPHHTTLSRRGRQLAVPLRARRASQPLHLLVDSTGLQIQGVSPWREWQGRRWRRAQAGRQDFRKVHLALDAASQSIVAVEVTDKLEHDHEQMAALLAQLTAPPERVIADGNYDFNACRRVIRARAATDLIPPRANAIIHPACSRPGRDEALRLIEQLGSRRAWKQHVGYHRRSLVETAMFRLKSRLGQRLRSREKHRQITEVRVWCRALNYMARLGLPHSTPAPNT